MKEPIRIFKKLKESSIKALCLVSKKFTNFHNVDAATLKPTSFKLLSMRFDDYESDKILSVKNMFLTIWRHGKIESGMEQPTRSKCKINEKRYKKDLMMRAFVNVL